MDDSVAGTSVGMAVEGTAVGGAKVGKEGSGVGVEGSGELNPLHANNAGNINKIK